MHSIGRESKKHVLTFSYAVGVEDELPASSGRDKLVFCFGARSSTCIISDVRRQYLHMIAPGVAPGVAVGIWDFLRLKRLTTALVVYYFLDIM